MRILIVDDDTQNSALLKKFLKPISNCSSAESGAQAIEIFKTAIENNEPFALILLDFKMPNMDGYDALKIIRKFEKQHGIVGQATVKIIMVTGMGDKETIIKHLSAGCDGYVVKPINANQLMTAINKTGLLKREMLTKSE